MPQPGHHFEFVTGPSVLEDVDPAIPPGHTGGPAAITVDHRLQVRVGRAVRLDPEVLALIDGGERCGDVDGDPSLTTAQQISDASTVDTYAAVADPVRREILSLLAMSPAAAGVVATAFGDISRPSVSRHLRVLREAGLVRADTDGRRRVCSATTGPLGEVSAWIDGLAPYVAQRLDALETEVCRTRRERLNHSSDHRTNEHRPAELEKEHSA